MSTIVGILTFISRINFVLSRVEHEKNITSGPDPGVIKLFSSSTQLSMIFILLISIKMQTILVFGTVEINCVSHESIY